MDNRRLHRTSDNYRLLVGDFIRSKLKIADSTKVIFCESHHTAHAYSTFCASSFSKSAVLIVDGLGSQQETHSIFKASTDAITHVMSQRGTGIGELYTLVTERLGFDVGEEGKTMGLAGYGLSSNQDSEPLVLKGSRFGAYCDYSHILRRFPSPDLKIDIPTITDQNNIYGKEAIHLAYSVQRECEETITYLAERCYKDLGEENLCYAGGVALNCVANERLNSLYNQNLFIQPASGDTGIPIGLALFGAHAITGKIPKLNNCDSSTGSDFYPYSMDKGNIINNSIEGFMNITSFDLIKKISIEYDVDKVVAMLEQDQVGALYSEGIEIGPRALGHRSFIANAKSTQMKQIMNEKIKHREPYRPFAPIVLESDYENYFQGTMGHIHKYMLGAPQCTQVARDNVPSVVHIDNTARVQAVNQSAGEIFQILERFKLKTGSSVLINTSFNDNNEPIVFSHLDALVCFLRTNCDFLILGGRLILREMIQDPDHLLKKLSSVQSNWIESYSRSALSQLTTIDSNDSADILSFTSFNLQLSMHNSRWALIQRLVEFLDDCNRNSNSILYTDSYHVNIISKLDSIFLSSKIQKNLRISIVNDDISSLPLPQHDDAYYLLYNLSVLMKGPGSQFYNSSDKIIQEDLFGKNSFKQECNDIEYIMNSYEVNQYSTIKDWFNTVDEKFKET